MAGVSVTYSFIDGAHFFTSEDPKWAGLCAASTELESAWDDVGIQLNHLAKVNHGMENPNFVPASSYPEFLKELHEAMQAELAKVAKVTSQLMGAVSNPSAVVPPTVAAWTMGQIAL